MPDELPRDRRARAEGAGDPGALASWPPRAAGAQLRRLPRWRGTWRSFLAERAHLDRLLLGLIEAEAQAWSRAPSTRSWCLHSARAGCGLRAEAREIFSLLLSVNFPTPNRMEASSAAPLYPSPAALISPRPPTRYYG